MGFRVTGFHLAFRLCSLGCSVFVAEGGLARGFPPS